jgi:uncharacterized RDD family membrane protein YckC
MSCPACGSAMPGGQERCPGCGASVAPLTEGALAPDPALRARAEPLREIPGLRKKEKTWKDEVRDRMRDRKRRRGEGDLPLFRDGTDGEAATDVDARSEPVTVAPPAPPARPPIVIAPHRMAARSADLGLGSVPIEVGVDESDLPLRPAELPRAAASTATAAAELRLDPAEAPARAHAPERPSDDEWSLGGEPTSSPRPVERPAYSGERARAAALDLALLTVLWAIVVYFASRAAHVDLVGLRPAWPYLAGYLAFLGLTYAGYFTGTTGQTLGKIATGLRVVDAGGRPPGYLRAFLRAALGSLGVLAAGAGLIPMLLDPARRALHDRVAKTRVVKH